MKETIFIKGEKINLCVMNKERHINNCYKWMNDPEINKWLMIGTMPISYENEENWFKNLESKENVVFAITTKDGKHIGQVGLHKIDHKDRRAEMGIVIGEKNEWGKGVAGEAEKLIANYGFEMLNLRKIHALIFSDNIGSIKAAEKNGAQKEGVLKSHIYKNGKYNDVICMAFFRK